jgi:phosphogluconate dehydratase
MIDQMGANPIDRKRLSCGNLAHGFAACSSEEKSVIKLMDAANVGIVTAYNDMLSAHQPYAEYPEQIKAAVRAVGGTAQVAGGVPAMCDGVTQGQDGMELSLFSRDNIAQGTAIALSHQMFDAALLLGICDKIVPGLLIGALQFGHLPVMLVPAGPMPSGLPNKEKVRIRQLFAEGKVGRDELLEAESASYHSAGTCTFYGTANTNQMMVEAMGLQLPGSSFVNPGTPLRDALTRFTAEQVTRITVLGNDYRPLGRVVDVKALVNALVALLASGGSTNHCIHLIAIARAAGYEMNWSDFDAVSKVTPLMARVYPNGSADINHFHAAGGTGYLFRSLLDMGLMHADAKTCFRRDFGDFAVEPVLAGDTLEWRPAPETTLDPTVIATPDAPFATEGGVRLLTGNLGRSVIKVSAVAEPHHVVRAPAVVVESQNALKPLFEAGELDRDCIIVVRFQGPAANGMPELHKLTPMLGVLQDRGYHVALVTDGRMSGASGKVPAAIHVSPEAVAGGMIAKVQDGDMITLDAHNGTLVLEVDDASLAARAAATPPAVPGTVGRGIFAGSRARVGNAERGASTLFAD